MTAVAVLTVKDEGAFLIEWLAHHRAVGFDHFVVFSNDCSDGTDAILDRCAEFGWLTHVRNDGPYDKGGIQFTAMKMADKMDVVKKADWLLPFDIDEFINIKVGDGTLPALWQALPEADAITLTWRLFGCGDVASYDGNPVTETFIKAAPEVMYWPWRHAMFKTLYRNKGIYRKLGIHRPRNPDPDRLAEARWFDGSGRELGEPFVSKRIFSNFGRPNYDLVQLNHYALGAMESYVLKAARGRAVHEADMLGLDYWVERNYATVEDRSILGFTAGQKERARLMADDQLAELHDKAVQWRKRRFQSLMEEEPYRALFGRLLQTPPSRPVTQKTAQVMTRFANAARAKKAG